MARGKKLNINMFNVSRENLFIKMYACEMFFFLRLSRRDLRWISRELIDDSGLLHIFSPGRGDGQPQVHDTVTIVESAPRSRP